MEKQEIYRALDEAYFSEGRHEKNVLDHLPELLKGAVSFVDIGASLGQYMFYANQVMQNGRLLAIEADPIRHERLREACEAWERSSTNRLSAVHAAATDRDGKVCFYTTNSSVSGGLFQHPTAQQARSASKGTDATRQWEPVTVDAVTLDSLFPDAPPDVVKIDVEGTELRVLRGAQAILSNGHTKFLIELHPWADPESGGAKDIVAFMNSFGYGERDFHGRTLFVKRSSAKAPGGGGTRVALPAQRAARRPGSLAGPQGPQENPQGLAARVAHMGREILKWHLRWGGLGLVLAMYLFAQSFLLSMPYNLYAALGGVAAIYVAMAYVFIRARAEARDWAMSESRRARAELATRSAQVRDWAGKELAKHMLAEHGKPAADGERADGHAGEAGREAPRGQATVGDPAAGPVPRDDVDRGQPPAPAREDAIRPEATAGRIAGMRDMWNELGRESKLGWISFLQKGAKWDDLEFHLTGIRFVDRMMQRIAEYGPIEPSRASVLEIGCGVGRFLRPLACRFKHVYGVDVSKEMIHNATEYCAGLPNVALVLNDGTSLDKFHDGSVDYVVSAGVFQHITDLGVILRYIHEALRVLSPGGLFLFQFEGNRTEAVGKDRLGAKIAARDLDSGLEDLEYRIREVSIDPSDPVRNVVVVVQKANDGESVAPAEKSFREFKMIERGWISGVYDDIKTRTQMHERLKSGFARLTFYD